MPRKIAIKTITFNAAFGITPEHLAKEITNLPLTALILNIDTVLRGYQAIASVTYYTQPERKPEDA